MQLTQQFEMIGSFTSVLAAFAAIMSCSGREGFLTAFEKYFIDNGPNTASHLVKARCKASEDYGLSINNKARFEVAQGHTILANTTPTAFWTLYHTFSDPATLAEVRKQVSTSLSVEIQKSTVAYSIDVSKICEVALLNSILHESLRHYGSGTGSRIVLEDTMLDGKYLLKKSSFVFMLITPTTSTAPRGALQSMTLTLTDS